MDHREEHRVHLIAQQAGHGLVHRLLGRTLGALAHRRVPTRRARRPGRRVRRRNSSMSCSNFWDLLGGPGPQLGINTDTGGGIEENPQAVGGGDFLKYLNGVVGADGSEDAGGEGSVDFQAARERGGASAAADDGAGQWVRECRADRRRWSDCERRAAGDRRGRGGVGVGRMGIASEEVEASSGKTSILAIGLSSINRSRNVGKERSGAGGVGWFPVVPGS